MAKNKTERQAEKESPAGSRTRTRKQQEAGRDRENVDEKDKTCRRAGSNGDAPVVLGIDDNAFEIGSGTLTTADKEGMPLDMVGERSQGTTSYTQEGNGEELPATTIHGTPRIARKARRHALASLLLVASEEMPPLESADRHPAPSQKLRTSKQPTPPVAPASAPPLSSALIAPSSLSLNLLPINPPSQTGESKLVVDKTINSSHKEKVPQQKARRHALASPPLVASDEMTPLEPADRHPAPSQNLPTSKQPTPPAAPASAPPLSSASIAPNPLFLNLLPINPPSQTGDSRVEDEVSHPGRRVCVEV